MWLPRMKVNRPIFPDFPFTWNPHLNVAHLKHGRRRAPEAYLADAEQVLGNMKGVLYTTGEPCFRGSTYSKTKHLLSTPDWVIKEAPCELPCVYLDWKASIHGF